MIKTRNTSCQPNYAIPPGETLRETLETIGMTQTELAERTGRPKKTINEIIGGKAAITAETALQLERVLGIPASFWNNLERNYQETRARLKEEEGLQKQLEWANRFPVSALNKLGWIQKEDSPVKVLKAILNFFGVAGIEEWKTFWENPQAAYRDSRAYQSNHYAVAAWLRKGETEAAQIETNPYNQRSFRKVLSDIRSLTTESTSVFEPEMTRMCAKVGVAVVFTPELPGTHVYGATRWLKATKALVQMSLRGKTNDHFWFTFFHEAGHIIYHGKGDMFIEAKNEDIYEKDKKEVEANQFSQNFLIPSEEYQSFIDSDDFRPEAIRRFAVELGIAPGIVVGRLQHDKIIPFNRMNILKKRFAFSYYGS